MSACYLARGAWLMVAASFLAWSGASFAQSEEAPEAPDVVTQPPPPEELSVTPAASANRSSDMLADHPARAPWPTELALRPLTLTPGMAELRPDFGVSYHAVFGGTFYGLTPAVGIGFGLTERLELDGTVGYFSGDVGVKYLVIASDALQVAPSFGVFGDPISLGLELGATTKLRFGQRFFILAGQDLARLFSFPGLSGGPLIRVQGNLSVGLQATPQLALMLTTRAFRFGATARQALYEVIGRDSVPLGVQALFGFNRWGDLLASASVATVNFQQPHPFTFAVGVNLRL